MTQQELDAVVAALDDALLTMSRPTTAALRLRLGWSRQKTYEAIREAVRLGMIERVGVTKWTWFRMPFRREDEFRGRLHAAMYRGAEAMREACAEACWSVPPDAHPSDCAFAVNALPIPEEP